MNQSEYRTTQAYTCTVEPEASPTVFKGGTYFQVSAKPCIDLPLNTVTLSREPLGCCPACNLGDMLAIEQFVQDKGSKLRLCNHLYI